MGANEDCDSAFIPNDRVERIEELKGKTAKTFVRSDAMYNPDKRTVGVFYESSGPDELNKDEMIDIERKSRASNSIFTPNTYTSSEFRSNLIKTTTQAEHHEGQYVGEAPNKQFNLRRTVISEYSNAKHNQTVFINPRFMSC